MQQAFTLAFFGLVMTSSVATANLNQVQFKPVAVPQGTSTGTTLALIGGSDNCATAEVIAGAGPFAYDTQAATTGTQGQANARCYIFNTAGLTLDVWFQWTATTTGWVAVNLCVAGAHDSKVAVYAGSGCPTGEPLICDDDYCGTLGATSKAPFFATAGATYTIQLGSYPGQGGAAGGFTIDPFTPVAGDDCAAPTAISGAGPFNFDNTSAVTGQEGQNEALCTNQMIMNDVWFRWTANCAGMTTVSLCAGTVLDTKLAIYRTNACPTAAAIECDDDFCSAGGPSEAKFTAIAGETYVFQVGLWPGEVPGVGAFTVTAPCPPSVGTPFCFGDGTGTACPCANNGAPGHGCASSVNPNGALLAADGIAMLSNDTVVLRGSSMPNASALYFQGTTQVSTLFGDGLRCAGGSVTRLGTKTNTAGASQYPGPGDLPVHIKGNITVPGTRTYQIWYRNAAAFCTPSAFNLSNGLSITWS